MLNSIPPPFEGEHIHSVLARFHVLEGKTDFNKTIREFLPTDKLLNNKKVWRKNFEIIWSKYQGILARDQLVNEHTSFSYDSKFLPEDVVTKVFLGSIDGSIWYSGLKNLYYSDVWRWCPDCVDEDVAKYGMRFWHVIHQVPSIISCSKHELLLNYSCESCEFFQDRLTKYELPPRDNECPKCGEALAYEKSDLSHESKWLQSLTTKLLTTPAFSNLQVIKSALKKAMACPVYESELSREHRTTIKHFQGLMTSSVSEGDYMPYFYFWSSSGERVATPYSVNLVHLMYREAYYPPLCFLAALRLFYSQEQVENMLLG
ncbi:MAG: TniQ family protein [Oceanospirillaceae bacterium]|nr:TniQ family protein [Oceanospirillaceae bacterium]